ncbi:MAG TPA: 1,4-alpha-glucan branching protein GlgB [Acidimicrobiia bacterium]
MKSRPSAPSATATTPKSGSTGSGSAGPGSARARSVDRGLADQVDRLLARTQHDPHSFLGVHPDGDDVVVRAFRPGGDAPTVVVDGDERTEIAMREIDARGLYEARLPGRRMPLDYRLRDAGFSESGRDPYAFLPSIGDLDLHLVGEGRHWHLGEVLGAHARDLGDTAGIGFVVWAPAARSVALVGDFNGWDDRTLPMRTLGSSGLWELFVPYAHPGDRYKYSVHGRDGSVRLHADPVAARTEVPPDNASVVFETAYQWSDRAWMAARETGDGAEPQPMSVYEFHPGSWRQGLDWRSLASQVADHVCDLGFTHVELMPVMEHPFSGSWGYQVTGFYAPTARYGNPDDFRAFVDELHCRGIGVILDWVPAHFPRDDWALARFDGTALYEHDDPRRGAHPDWGTLIFNYGRNEVRNFLIGSALAWLRDFHVDALRVDAVASMLYLDYSRREGEWVPNRYGGREDLEAVDFIRELNEVIASEAPGAYTVAEESTAWGGVSRPVADGGLGFRYKWNMGWMHDTLDYFAREGVYRRFHHNELTFSMVYAYSERYVLPLSHDEVVHGKRSLLGRMPGDRWQQLANLRSLYAYMWAHPGKKLLFMGGELAQEHEWNHEASIDWGLRNVPGHAGMESLLRDLNRVYRCEPALWSDDDPAAFRWLEADDADHNVFAFVRFDSRRDGGARPVVCVANLSPVPRHDYQLRMPSGGVWDELVDSDSSYYGGSDVGNGGSLSADAGEYHGCEHSARLVLPPLGVLWLGRRGD